MDAPTLADIYCAPRCHWKGRCYLFHEGALYSIGIGEGLRTLRCIGPLDELVALRFPEEDHSDAAREEDR